MNCPKCNYHFDEHTNLKDPTAKPSEGDISICFNCLAVLMFTKDTVVELSKSEIEYLPYDTRIAIGDIIDALKQQKEQMGR